jgi:hypothetical protein
MEANPTAATAISTAPSSGSFSLNPVAVSGGGTAGGIYSTGSFHSEHQLPFHRLFGSGHSAAAAAAEVALSPHSLTLQALHQQQQRQIENAIGRSSFTADDQQQLMSSLATASGDPSSFEVVGIEGEDAQQQQMTSDEKGVPTPSMLATPIGMGHFSEAIRGKLYWERGFFWFQTIIFCGLFQKNRSTN